jgi:hypothetical protein
MRSISTLVGVEAPDACGHLRYKMQVFLLIQTKTFKNLFSMENAKFFVFHFPFSIKLNVCRRNRFARRGRMFAAVYMIVRRVRYFAQVNHRKQCEHERLHKSDENR